LRPQAICRPARNWGLTLERTGLKRSRSTDEQIIESCGRTRLGRRPMS